MISMQNISFLMVAGLTIFVGCTPNGGTSKDSSPRVSMPPAAHGTVDSGGGNTYMGKPLESYIKKPLENVQASRNLIQPILNSLRENAPSIEPIFSHILNKKVWYFVPGELASLPQEKIGAVIKTDQGALQDFNQVWIGTDIFDKMTTEEDQAKLILHEVLMGFRLLRFDSSKNECLAFEIKPTECIQNAETVRGKPSDLTDKDYADIRAAVVEIFAKYKKMEFADWDDLLWRYGFSSFDRRFVGKKSHSKITPQQLGEMISSAKMIGYWPKYGFESDKLAKEHPELIAAGFNPAKPFIWKSSEACDVTLSLKDNRFEFQLTTDRGKTDNYITFSPIGLELVDDEGLDAEWYSGVRIYSDRSETNKIIVGGSIYEANLGFIGSRLNSVNIYEMVCLNQDCSSYSGKENGLNYTCSSQSQMTLGKAKP